MRTPTDSEGSDLAGGLGQNGEEYEHAEAQKKFQAMFLSLPKGTVQY